jgi:hypothetical protein
MSDTAELLNGTSDSLIVIETCLLEHKILCHLNFDQNSPHLRFLKMFPDCSFQLLIMLSHQSE